MSAPDAPVSYIPVPYIPAPHIPAPHAPGPHTPGPHTPGSHAPVFSTRSATPQGPVAAVAIRRELEWGGCRIGFWLGGGGLSLAGRG